jgi:general secretion pathway protein L
MQEKLIIILNARDAAHPAYVVMNNEGQISQQALSIEGAELKSLTTNREVWVVVPGEDVIITSVTLPKMNRSRLLQAIPYALEEQIIEDVDTLHFAVGDYKPDQPISVMIVSRNKMNEWMTLMQSWQITADCMLPEFLAIPVTADAWSVVMNDIAIVRTGQLSGFACDRVNAGEMLVMAIADAQEKPALIDIKNESDAEPRFTLSTPVQVQAISAESRLELIASTLREAVTLNLLQGDFQAKKSRGLPKLSNLLKVCVYLLAAWAALLFLYPIVSYAILDKRASEISGQIAVIYKKHFPNASSILVPKERMQEKLNKLSSDMTENRMLMMLSNIGSGLSQASGVQLKRLEFQNNQMTLEMTAASSVEFSRFADVLTQQGLHVKQQNANLTGERVSATLQIE